MSAEVVIPIRIRDLTHADLPHCTWAGSPLHLRGVAKELDRVASGVAEYLAVCVAKTDRPVAIGGIDYELAPGAPARSTNSGRCPRSSPAASARR